MRPARNVSSGRALLFCDTSMLLMYHHLQKYKKPLERSRGFLMICKKVGNIVQLLMNYKKKWEVIVIF
jgi:hypothetical protein